MNAIAAVSASWGIGREGDLIFRISEDLKRFRALTTGGAVIMGRRTLDSMPGGRPLPNRRSIVLTRDAGFSRPGVETAGSVEEALALTAGEDPERVWLCGGGEVYRLLLPCCRRCCLTRVYADPPCDVWFPDLDRMREWKLLHAGAILSDGALDYQFAEYVNTAPLRADGR